MKRPNALYAQSGGVTAVINATAQAVIETARQHDDRIGTVYAARYGIVGVLREELYDTASMSAEQLASMSSRPGGLFGSCRYKLADIDEDPALYQRLIDVFSAHDIEYFFYNGGGDSADTALKLSRLSAELNYPLQCIAVPKTVDNDLPVTDNCPGFGSVAKYVSTCLLEASLDVRSMNESSTRVFIMEVMGRHAGWIAASAGLVKDSPVAPPLIILFPEIRFDQRGFLGRVDGMVSQHGYCCVVASEGLLDEQGAFLSDMGTTDAFGHAQLGGVAPVLSAMVSSEIGHKTHWAVPDYLQRSARHLASATDLEQAYAVGREAVMMALNGRNAVMPVIRRLEGSPYRWELAEGDLNKIANVEKKLPASFISSDGYGVTEEALRYLRPLVIGEAQTAYRDGLPVCEPIELGLIDRHLPDYTV